MGLIETKWLNTVYIKKNKVKTNFIGNKDLTRVTNL